MYKRQAIAHLKSAKGVAFAVYVQAVRTSDGERILPALMNCLLYTSHRAGFEYVKMDFMTHGAMEADKWYNPEIQTGIQGYNYGMQLLDVYKRQICTWE